MDSAVESLTAFHLVTSGLHVADLVAAIDHSSLWDEITARQKFPGSAHHATRSILLRWSRALDADATFNDLEACDLVEFEELPGAQSIVHRVLDAVEATELGRVMLVELPPGCSIDPHADAGRYANHYDRFHVALQSDEGNSFTCDGETIHMRPGEAWWFNHRKTHCVQNLSNRPRYHLIIDCVAKDYRACRYLAEARIVDGVTYGREIIHDVWDEMQPLLEKHYLEIAHYQDIALAPDHAYYLMAEDALMLRVFTARVDDVLVGYSIHRVGQNPHYRHSKQSNQDVLFVSPEHRRSRIGVNLISYTNDRLRDEGCQVSYQHAKVGHPALAMVLQRLGFQKVDEIWAKRLDKEA